MRVRGEGHVHACMVQTSEYLGFFFLERGANLPQLSSGVQVCVLFMDLCWYETVARAPITTASKSYVWQNDSTCISILLILPPTATLPPLMPCCVVPLMCPFPLSCRGGLPVRCPLPHAHQRSLLHRPPAMGAVPCRNGRLPTPGALIRGPHRSAV